MIAVTKTDAKVSAILQELVRRSNEETGRLRALEQQLQALENRMKTLEETSIERAKKFNTKFTEIDAMLRNVGDEVLKLNNSMEKFNRQVSKFARKKDIKEIENMFDLLSPIKQEFVTKEELEEELKSRD